MFQWIEFTGDYEKIWYDVKLLDGGVVHKCWPNYNHLCSTDGSGRKWGVEDQIQIRVSE